jgi:exodeoxyribonuclease VII large subunit
MPLESHIRLSQLTQTILTTVEDAFAGKQFWVVADVTSHSFKADKNYHNLELVEKDTASNAIVAKMAAKAWGSGSAKIAEFEKHTEQKFTNNLQVLTLVSVGFHQQYGLTLTIIDVDTAYTLGRLEQQRNATLEQLVMRNPFINKDGEVFITHNNTLKLNPVLQRIALISSSVSAGSEDFTHTLSHNAFGYTFAVDNFYTTVQGDRNAGQFLDKLLEVYHSGIPYDAVVIARGGGAQTDFLIFDNYRIARAIAKFPIPVITGIGHQKNQTITDMMAHTQTKTPTKAAEFIIAHNKAFEDRLYSMQKDIVISTQKLLSAKAEKLTSLQHSVATNIRSLLYRKERDLNNAAAQFIAQPKIIVNNRHNDLKILAAAIKAGTLQYLKNKTGTIENTAALVQLMSPDNILKKGYAIIKKGNLIITSPDAIQIGDRIDIILSDTTIKTTVEQKAITNGQ